MFNGTHWVWITSSYDSNTTYQNVTLGHGYATCSTAEATVAKVGTLASYALTVGGIVAVKFTNAVPANATLNINSKGAKNIFYRGAKIIANVIKAGDVATFIYDGTQYQLLSIDRWQKDISQLQGTIVDHKDNTTIHIASTERTKWNKNITDIQSMSLGMGEDGRIYLLRNGVAQGNGIELPVGETGDVVGNIGADNIIILSGELEDGTYTLKYEMEDGTLVSIGELVKGAKPVEPVNQFVATTDWINKYLSTSTGAFSSRGGSFCVEVDGISLADNNPYIVRISGVTLVKDSGDGSYGRISLLKSDGTVVTTQHITDGKITKDGDSWYLDIHKFSSDATITKCRMNMCIRTDRSTISLSDVANAFVEFEPLNG
jgi:hypothetical protein